MPPESGNSYDISVPPGGNKTIVIKCDPEGYGMSSTTITKVAHGDDKLMQMCLNKGKKQQRDDEGNPVDIFQYSLQHDGGVAYLYVNETPNRTLDEDLEFQIQGLELEENPGQTEINVKVGPGQKRLVKLAATTGPWKIGVGVAFVIE